jgi:hypothetical protein
MVASVSAAHAGGVLGDGLDLGAEPDLDLVVHGLVQGGLQVAAQQREVRLAEHRGDGGLGDGEPAASSGVDVDELPQVDVLLLESREDAEALGGLVAGGRDVDEVAVAAAGERLFDDPAAAPKPSGCSSGRPKGRASGPTVRHPAIKKPPKRPRNRPTRTARAA